MFSVLVSSVVVIVQVITAWSSGVLFSRTSALKKDDFSGVLSFPLNTGAVSTQLSRIAMMMMMTVEYCNYYLIL